MGHSALDPAFQERRPWNEGRLLGAKRALKQQQVWAIRFWLDPQLAIQSRFAASRKSPLIHLTRRPPSVDLISRLDGSIWWKDDVRLRVDKRRT